MYSCISVCLRMCRQANHQAPVRNSEDNFAILSFNHVGPRDRIQIVRLGSKCP